MSLDIEAIQDDIMFGSRDDFTDEELIVAFKETVSGYSAEEIRRGILPQVYGDWIDFVWKNCDDCPGANGLDRRCCCGNRRVYWSKQKDGSFDLEAD